jgi:TolB protein
VAQEFASDILARFGGKSLMGTRIFFVSNRTGNKEIWSMDYDGANQKQVTFYKSTSTFPAVSADGTKIAFTSYLRGNPSILIHSVETGRNLRFYNQVASMNAASDFTPDSQQLLLYSTAGNLRYAQLFIANVDGTNFRRLSNSQAIEVEPKVNPKTGREVVFVSGRSGMPQIYKMNMDGADVVRLTTGEGEAVNPAWHPDGQHIAFAWTRGYEPGNYNIFVMDVATQQFVQLTHGTGRNENPSWAPDGRHIVFSSNRSGRQQIWTMRADGTELKPLTTQGVNEKPVWTR